MTYFRLKEYFFVLAKQLCAFRIFLNKENKILHIKLFVLSYVRQFLFSLLNLLKYFPLIMCYFYNYERPKWFLFWKKRNYSWAFYFTPWINQGKIYYIWLFSYVVGWKPYWAEIKPSMKNYYCLLNKRRVLKFFGWI